MFGILQCNACEFALIRRSAVVQAQMDTTITNNKNNNNINNNNNVNAPINRLPIDTLNQLFKDQMRSDVKFVFPGEYQMKCSCPSCDCDTKHMTIPAHRLVLAQGSGKFRQLFNGANETEELPITINITDASSATFSEYLQIFYCAYPVFSDDRIGGVLQLINDYGDGHFVSAVEDYMMHSVTIDNCLAYLDLALVHGLRMKLLGTVRQYIRVHANDIFDTDGFRECSMRTLETILELRDLKCSEVDVFVAAMDWATKQCCKQGLDVTDANRRAVLGTCFHLVRFPTMSTEEFSHCLTRHPALLEAKEMLEILAYLILKKPLSQTSSFSNLPRMID